MANNVCWSNHPDSKRNFKDIVKYDFQMSPVKFEEDKSCEETENIKEWIDGMMANCKWKFIKKHLKLNSFTFQN